MSATVKARRLVQIAVAATAESEGSGDWALFGLCDDGTLWSNGLDQHGWYRFGEPPRFDRDESETAP